MKLSSVVLWVIVAVLGWVALVITVLLLSAVVAGAQNGIPAGFQGWQVNDTTARTRIGGEIANYPEISGVDTTWTAIANDWLTDADSAYNLTDILKTRIKANGESVVRVTWDGVEYSVTQKLAKLVWVNTSTWNWVDVTGPPSWPTPSVDSNIVSWRGVFPGVDYRVRKRNATVEHGIFFKPAFLDSAVALYNQRADSLDIALANVMTYTLSASVDDADSAIGTVNKRRLKQLGRYAFELSRQYVHFPGSDTLPTLWVKQRWERRGNVIVCAEYVMMSRLKQIHTAYPNATIWHNDVTKIEGSTNIEDAYITTGGNAEKNYGVSGTGFVYKSGATYYHILNRVLNVASLIGAGQTISVAVCSLYCSSNSTNGTVNVYSVFKPWNEGVNSGGDPVDAPEGEGMVTWMDWSQDDEEWTTAGCNSGDDGGSDNSGDGTGADRKATPESSVSVTAIGWYGFTVSAALAQAWYDNTKNEEGVIFQPDGSDQNNGFRMAEYGSNQPHWTFTHSAAAAGEDNIIPLLDRRPIRGVGRGIGYKDEDSFETFAGAVRGACGISSRLCD